MTEMYRMDAVTIEASYPLSPVQHGMLFHSLYAERSGVYVQQMVCDLNEDLDVGAFARAWARLVERHAILRTSFRWEGLDEPLQEVRRSAELPLERHDWSGLPEAEREARF